MSELAASSQRPQRMWDVLSTGLVPILTPVLAESVPPMARGTDLGPPPIGGVKNPHADATTPPADGKERLADIIQFPSGKKK